MIKAIMCVGRNGELGDSKRPDGLPWENNKDDLNYFKSKTGGSIVVMGRKTYDSLPFENGLPNRKNYVLTSTPYSEDLTWGFIPAAYPCKSSSRDSYYCSYDFITSFMERTTTDMWVIGGKSIYDQCMPYVEEVHITMIDKDFPEADTHMDSNFLREFELQSLTGLNDYSIVYVYKRKK